MSISAISHLKIQWDGKVNGGKLFAGFSVIALVVCILIGQPVIGTTLAFPFLSWMLIRRMPLLLAAYLYIPFYKSVIQSYTPIDATVWLAVLSLVCLLFHSVVESRVQVAPMHVLWLALVIVMTLATFWSMDVNHSITLLVETFLLTVLPLLLVFQVASRRQYVWSFLQITLAGSVILSLVGIFSMLANDTGRLALTSNTIGAGRIAIMGLLLAFVVIPKSPRKKVMVASIILLTFIAALASGSRGPLLAGVVSLLAVYGVWSKWFAIRLLGFMAAIAGGLVFLFTPWIEAIIPVTSVDRLRRIFESVMSGGGSDNSILARFELLSAAVKMWSERPFTGWGIGTFGIYSMDNPDTGSHTYPHNMFLQVGSEMGTIGLVVVGLMVVWALMSMYSRLKDPVVQGVTLLTLFALVSAQFSNNIYDNRWLWGMILLGGSMTFIKAARPIETARGQSSGRNVTPPLSALNSRDLS